MDLLNTDERGQTKVELELSGLAIEFLLTSHQSATFSHHSQRKIGRYCVL